MSAARLKSDRVYLEHILDCIGAVQQFMPRGRTDLDERKTRDAVLRNLQTLGESAKRVSPELKLLRPEIEWKAIAGFRDVVVHDYLGLDMNRVWVIIQRDIPPLKSAVEHLLKELSARGE